jgi:PAS domain S-box-containing protein
MNTGKKNKSKATQKALSSSKKETRPEPPLGEFGNKTKGVDTDKNKIQSKLNQFRSDLINTKQTLRRTQAVLDCVEGPIFSVDRNYCYTSFNIDHALTMKNLYGVEIAIGKNILEYHTNPEDRKHARNNLDRAFKGEKVHIESFAGEDAESRRYFEITHYPIKGSNGTIEQVTVCAKDITELRNREEENQRISRTTKALSNSNQAMMRAKNETEFMEEVCRNIENDCGYAMVWIGIAQKDKNKSVHPVISAGFENGYLENANISWGDNERGRGPTGTAIRTGKVSLCRDMLTDPKFIPWRKEALRQGYASSIALPLIAGDRPFGALTIYSKQPDAFKNEQVKLLSELASDLAYGITAFKLRAQQKRAEETLRDSEEKLRHANDLIDTVTEGTRVIISTVDTNFRYTYFNKSYEEEIVRLSGKNIQIGSSMVETFADSPEQQKVAFQEWSRTLNGISSNNIVEFGDPGRYRRVYNVRRTPIRNADGIVVGAGEVASDITEQEQAKKALVESETRFQSLFVRMTEGFALHEIICDENNVPCDYKYLDINPAFEKLTG